MAVFSWRPPMMWSNFPLARLRNCSVIGTSGSTAALASARAAGIGRSDFGVGLVVAVPAALGSASGWSGAGAASFSGLGALLASAGFSVACSESAFVMVFRDLLHITHTLRGSEGRFR